jgi:hypothetical protein
LKTKRSFSLSLILLLLSRRLAIEARDDGI